MAGAAISPPATSAVDPSRSFFIILPLSLSDTGTYQRPVPTGGKCELGTQPHTTPAKRYRYKNTGRKGGSRNRRPAERFSPHLWRLCHILGPLYRYFLLVSD